MASNSETGHPINLSNFKLMIDHCTAIGVPYNPSNSDIGIVAMTSLWNSSKTAHETLTATLMATKNDFNNRQILFEPSSKLVTRTLNYFKSTKASKQIKEDAKGLADRFRGHNLSAKKLPDGTPDPNDVSNSHQSYEMKADTFRQLVDLYESSSFYAPNEASLSIVELRTLSDAMATANEDISETVTRIVAERNNRNRIMYTKGRGIPDVAMDCKSYVNGLLGMNSAIAKTIRKIKFIRFQSVDPIP